MSEPTAQEVWREPVRGGYPPIGLLGLSGRERLGVWRMGTLPPPPLFHLTGARPTGFGSGTAEAEMPASEWLLNPAGVIGGGTLAILADIALGCSVESELPPATPYASAELSLSFLRPARAGGVLEAGGQAIDVGGTVALSEAFLLDRDSEQLIAHGTSRIAVLPPLDPAPEPPRELSDYEVPDYPSPDPYLRPVPADAILPQEVWDELSGAEILARQMRGELPAPPIHHLTGIAPVEAGEGKAAFVMPASEWLNQPGGILQGGTIAMLADTAMIGAAMTMAPAGTAIAGLDLKVNFLRPVEPDGRDLRARAEIVHSGRAIAVARARVEDAEGRPVALATGSAMFLEGRPASLGELELGAERDQ